MVTGSEGKSELKKKTDKEMCRGRKSGRRLTVDLLFLDFAVKVWSPAKKMDREGAGQKKSSLVGE